jgi:hypothetical protein
VHSVAVIVNFGGRIGGCGRRKAGPARAAIEFIGRLEQQRSATAAMKRAIALFDIQRSAKRPFGTRFAQYMILYRGKARAPFVFIKVEFFHDHNVAMRAANVKSRSFTNNSPQTAKMAEWRCCIT